MLNLETVLREKYSKGVITAEELAVELGVEEEDVMEEIKNNNLKSRKFGKKTLITIEEVGRLFGENQSNDTQYQEMLDQMATPTLTCQQVIEDETIIIVECDVNMSKGCVTYVQSSNRWLYQIDMGRTPDGKRIRKSKSFKTEAEAREALEFELGECKVNSNQGEQTLKQFLEYVISDINKSKARTKQGYYCSARMICRIIGDCKVNEIGTKEINSFFDYCTKEYTQASVNKAYVLLNMAFDYALEEQLIEKNPMRYIKKRNKPKAWNQPNVGNEEDKLKKGFEKEELNKLLELAREDKQIYPMLLLLQYTGLRVGELRALEWKDIDLTEGKVHIRKAATTTTEKTTIDKPGRYTAKIGATKSEAGVRTLHIPSCVVDTLKAWKVDNEEYRVSKGYKDEGFVFPSKTGGLLTHSGVASRFGKFLKKNGLEHKGYHLYMFRHTFCTSLMRSGINLTVVKQMMGDSTTDVILKIYTAVNKEDTKSASMGLEEYYRMQN